MTKKSLVMLLSGIALLLVFIFIIWQSNKDITSDWDEVFLQQTSYNSATQYSLYFFEGTLSIDDTFTGAALGYDFTEEDFKKHFTITDTILIPGKYEKYSVSKNKDAYTIKIAGDKGFTYTLNKVAPRKYIGEDGVEYSTSAYLD